MTPDVREHRVFLSERSRSVPKPAKQNDRDWNIFLVHIHADIFAAGHKGRSSSGADELALKPYSTRGALL
jgi:hypothetical protein